MCKEFDKYLARKGLNDKEYADIIGATAMSIGRYRRGRIPEKDIMLAIAHESRGEVTPNTWYGYKPPKPKTSVPGASQR
jgi:hypothetical protein